jgi:ABC-2 type transport system ATP-binding protein
MTKQSNPERLAIKLDAVSKIYRQQRKNEVRAVNQLSLAIEPGQVFGFLGANGAGKTTTIKMICGLIIPSAGTITVNGYDLARQRSAVMGQIGAVLEGTRNIHWRLSSWQNLMYAGHLKQCYGKRLHQRAEQLLRELDLWERRHDPTRLFSRGMQQKVAIACALISDPSIILLDEPTLGLDVQAARTVKEWILKLVKEQGKTVILTTHQLDIAEDLCENIAIMRRGSLLANQPLASLRKLFRQEYYQIRVRGTLERPLSPALEGFTVTVEEDETVLSGSPGDQAQLNHIINDLYDQGLFLNSVHRVEPNLEDIFVSLIEGKAQTKEVDCGHSISYV